MTICGCDDGTREEAALPTKKSKMTSHGDSIEISFAAATIYRNMTIPLEML